MTETWSKIQSSFIKLIGNSDVASVNPRLTTKIPHMKIQGWITDFLTDFGA